MNSFDDEIISRNIQTDRQRTLTLYFSFEKQYFIIYIIVYYCFIIVQENYHLNAKIAEVAQDRLFDRLMEKFLDD